MHGSVERLRTERSDRSNFLFNTAIKIGRHARLAFRLRSTQQPVLFISVERGRGKVLQRLLLKLAGRRFDSIVFVYHIWDGFDLGTRFRRLALERADRVLHVALCDCHADRLRSVMESSDQETVLQLSNTAWMSRTLSDPPPQTPTAGAVGMISNLTREKGADTFVRLASASSVDADGPDFVLAGPVRDSVLMPDIEHAVANDSLSYVGPVAPEARHEFMSDLSVLVFPTRYRSETEPLIVLEALRQGVPVLASAVGCLTERLPESWLMALDASDDEWMAMIRKLTENPEESAHIARTAWSEIDEQSSQELDAVLSWLGLTVSASSRTVR